MRSVKCGGGCGRVYGSSAYLDSIERIRERVGPGELMPSGQCPECGSLCYLVGHMVLPLKRSEDLLGLVSYIFEFDRDDFVNYLRDNEDEVIEDGILTEDDYDILWDDTDVSEVQRVVDKAAEDERSLHVYGLASRLWNCVRECLPVEEELGTADKGDA